MVCKHRWSTIKRWEDKLTGLYHIIQRCRRCESWVRRDMDIKTGNMNVVSQSYRLENLSNEQQNPNSIT
jgi:hypothetical protein